MMRLLSRVTLRDFRGRRIVVLLLAAMKMVGFMLQMIRLQLAMMRVLLKSYSTLATMTMTVPVKRSRNYCVTVQLLIVILLCANCGRAEQVDYLIQKGSGNRKNDNEPIIIAADIM